MYSRKSNVQQIGVIMKKKLQKIKLNILKLIKKIVVTIFKKTYALFYKRIKMDHKTIIFVSFHGRGYSCNPKAMHQYLSTHEKYREYTFIWALKDVHQQIDNATVIRYNGLMYYYYMAKSKYWIINCKLPKHMLKKEEQIYLQTWHGTPLKRLAHDILASDDVKFYRSEITFKQMTSTYDNDVDKYNYMISPNPFSTNVFQSAFQINEERLIDTGYPRNDYLVHVSVQEQYKLRSEYGIDKDKKVILYAPTWRDTSFNSKGYVFKLEANFKRWKEVLGDEYVVIFKPHYLIINEYVNDLELEGFIIHAKATQDINELYSMSDILVTDYSSVFFDYANLNRPIYFYMFDLASYQKELRGFYFDIYQTLPGEILEKEDDLLQSIQSGTYDYERLQAFNSEFNSFHDGHCCEKVSNIIFN